MSGPASRRALLQEQRYQRHFAGDDARLNGRVLGVLAACYAVAAKNDLELLRGSPLLGVAFALRALLVASVVLMLVLARRARGQRQVARASWVGHVGVAVGTAGVSLTRIPTGAVPNALIAIGALIAVAYFAERGPIGPRATMAVVNGVAVVAALLLSHTRVEAPLRLTGPLSFFMLNVAGIFSARAFDRERRRRFEAERAHRLKIVELRAEKARAESLARARTTFLAAMSHEFRTPMNAVVGLSEILLRSPLPTADRRHARTIHDSARTLLRLLEDILDFARIDADKLALQTAPFDLRRLAASVADMLRPTAEGRSIALSLDVAEDVPSHVAGDEARLRQVLVNLAANAVKFTGPGGAVRIGIARRAVEDGGAPEIAFRVEDTGIGMGPDTLERLFRPFEQADQGIARRYGGSGLGLAISRRIITAMGGDIHVESAPGRGSVFSFALRLPVAAAPEASDAPASRGRPPLSILVVDDQPVNREVARALFGQLGHAVDLAGDGPEAVAAATRGAYDVVFMDLEMPGMSGIEAAMAIRQATADRSSPAIVALTASLFDADREACRRAGMADFLGKPVDLAALDAALARVAAARGAATPTVSGARIAGLRRLEVAGQPQFFAELCRLFLTGAREGGTRMKDAVGRRDPEALAGEAHKLRSAAATLGADEVSALCVRIELASREGRMDDAGAIVEGLTTALLRVEEALGAEPPATSAQRAPEEAA